MNHWQLLNNWFVNNIEMLSWSLLKYENKMIKHYSYTQEQNVYSCICKLLTNDY